MAAKQVSGNGGGSSPALAGMSTTQLYDIMSQMKMLIDQNKEQARLILVQNPPLTKALFQAQVMLGMVQPPQATPTTPSTTPQHLHRAAIPSQTTNNKAPAQFSQNQKRKQQPSQPIVSNPQTLQISPPNPLSQSKPISPPNLQPQSRPPHLSQPVHQATGHLTSQPTSMSITTPSQIPGLSQFPQHSSSQSQPLSHHLPTVPTLSAPQSQQPMQNTGGQYMPLQPSLPPQPRPPQMPAFPHQGQHLQMGKNLSFQHPTGPQMQPQQNMFHSGKRPPTGPSYPHSAGPSYPHSNQSLPPSVYQAGNPRKGMEFNHGGSSKQPDRGSSWMTTGPPADNATGTQIPGLLPTFPGPMGPTNQPARPPSLSPETEKALLQQVMSLTPEQINMLPADQRNQVLQLQQMLRQ